MWMEFNGELVNMDHVTSVSVESFTTSVGKRWRIILRVLARYPDSEDNQDEYPRVRLASVTVDTERKASRILSNIAERVSAIGVGV